MKKTTIAIIDDHKLVREMWTRMFMSHSEIEIIGESGTLEYGVEMVKVKKPDIVFLDINMPKGSGIDAVPLIRKFSPGTRIIAVSMHNQVVFAKKMLQLGAKGYVTKNSSHEEIFNAITAVMNGSIYVCTEIKDIISEQVMGTEIEGPDVNELTLREIEIIKLIKNGSSSKEISAQLNIAIRTVEVHRHNILKKLKLKNTPSLINFINTTNLSF